MYLTKVGGKVQTTQCQGCALDHLFFFVPNKTRVFVVLTGVECPSCRKALNVEPGKISSLPRNLALENIVIRYTEERSESHRHVECRALFSCSSFSTTTASMVRTLVQGHDKRCVQSELSDAGAVAPVCIIYRTSLRI